MKQLYQILAESEPSGIAAIISTSWDAPDSVRMKGIPYICRQYRDIDYDAPGSFSDTDAEALASFVHCVSSDTNVKILYVCCDAATSRSPAVYASIARMWKVDFEEYIFRNPLFSPNMLVFQKLSSALGVPLSDEECDKLFYLSRKAFKDTTTKVKLQRVLAERNVHMDSAL